MEKNSRIFVAGHRGLVGSAIWKSLEDRGYSNLIGRTHRELDLDPQVRWIDLRVLSTAAGGPDDQYGRVEFIARYRLGGRAHRLHEQSRFERHQGRWSYVDGELGAEA